MNLIVFAMRRPFATLMLAVAIARGGVLGVSKVRAEIFPPLKTPEVRAEPGSIGTRAKQSKGHSASQLESHFPKQDEQPKSGHRKIVLTSPKSMDVTVTQRYVCHIHSQRHIKIRALEGGYLTEISVRGGQTVKKGDLMFKIVSARARAKAELAKAQSDFTIVIAPFDGIVGRLHEQLGSLIKEGDVLTTLSDNSVMWVYFNVPEKRYLEYMASRKQRSEDRKIDLVLANGTKFPQSGKITAIQAQFDHETGLIPFRADFPNPDRLLRHGQTGTILISRNLHDAIVIPQRATYEIMDKRYVSVVDKDDVVHRREIVVSNEMDDIFVIRKGVGVGDRIVLEGILQVRDGEKVEYELRPPEEVNGRVKNHADPIVVTSPQVSDVIIAQRYVGRVHSQRHINVGALASGYLNEVRVTAGQAVKKGDLMFKIVAAPNKAKLDSESANVRAPFDGIVNRLHKQSGSLIKEGDILTTLSDNGVMWVYFNVPEKQYLEYTANRKQHEEDRIELVLANHTKFPQPGKIGAIDAEFNNETGNIAFRADFPNPDGLLRQGQTGIIQISRTLRHALVIPQRAVFEHLDKRYVYVVGDDDVVHEREIEVQNEMDDIFVITKGLDVKNRIVLEGIRQVRDGEKVEYKFRPPEEVMPKLKSHAE
jgi:membrane fusion protein (multidrug efflux system)